MTPHRNPLILIAFIITSSLGLTIASHDADAGRYKLKCKDHYQIVQGNLISTPPCEEAYIAKIARGYGYRVSKVDIQNPHKKQEICNHIGHDTRINHLCETYNLRPSFRGR